MGTETLRDARRRRLLGGLLLAPALAGLPLHGAHAHGEAHPGARPAEALPPEQKPWGIAGQARAVTRTVEVRMLDTMRFTPDRLVVRRGETLRLRIHNTGHGLHEFVLGTPQENAAHAELMKRFPDMAHDEPYMAHVPPGATGEIVWRFNRAGTFEFACLIAGHYDAGMTGTVQVR